jgi:hypothetical protein
MVIAARDGVLVFLKTGNAPALVILVPEDISDGINC